MHRVGTVVRTAQGLAILRADAVDGGERATDIDGHRDDIGTMVIDDDLETVGRVVDVFGPVSRPYLAVTPDDGVHLPSLVGSTLYAR
ncbi:MULTISPECIES: H/ACA ribonucleoprotein complex subunit GAR1 [Natrinema]|uniref:H/ACA RNA-protein complex component Gar1 n=1 Tax=Natrinema gari JCM 14663 TaxID=1230459 RepID=L9YQ07_9EURY|nr:MULTISPECIES: Gar1/Naf1 family protein [Natrinema]AFO58203.1 H/ACA RNA-protein complex component Gar1 [Natrinema sp. J7-2]ELY76320.1 H/ACA RNA-protein complex component Gar1 [Natrinema gari JCM 14663]